MTIPPDLPAAVEHVANAIYDVLIPALITWILVHAPAMERLARPQALATGGDPGRP